MAQTFGPKVLPQITPMEYINDTPLLPLPFDQLYKMEESLFQRDMMRERMDMEREKFGWEREQFEWAKEKHQWDKQIQELKLFQTLAGSMGGMSGGSGGSSRGKSTGSGNIIPYNSYLERVNQEYLKNQAAAQEKVYSGFESLDVKNPGSFRNYFIEAQRAFSEVENNPEVLRAKMYSKSIEDILDPEKVKLYDPIYMNDVMRELKSADSPEKMDRAMSRLQSSDIYAVDYGAEMQDRWEGFKDQLILDPEYIQASTQLGGIFTGVLENKLLEAADNMLPSYIESPEGRAHLRNQMILAKNTDPDIQLLRAGYEAQGLPEEKIEDLLQEEIVSRAYEKVKETFISSGAKHLGIHGMHNLSKDALENITTGGKSQDSSAGTVGGRAIEVSAGKTEEVSYSDYNPLEINKDVGKTNKQIYTEQRDILDKELEDLNQKELQLLKMDLNDPVVKQQLAETQKKIEENSAYVTALNDRLDVFQNVEAVAEEELFRVKGPEYREKIEEAHQYFINNPDQANETIEKKLVDVVVATPDGPEIRKEFRDVSNLSRQARRYKNLLEAHEESLRKRIDDKLVKQQETSRFKFEDNFIKVDGKTSKVTDYFEAVVTGHDNWPGMVAVTGGKFISGGKEIEVGAGQPLPEGVTLAGKNIEGVSISKELYASKDGVLGNRIYVTYTEKETDSNEKTKDVVKEVSFIDANNRIISQIKGIPEVEDIARSTNLNIALRPFIAYKENPEANITNIDFRGKNIDYRISRINGAFEIHMEYGDEEGRITIPGNVESVKDYIKMMESSSQNANPSSNPTETTQNRTINNETDVEILRDIPELLSNDNGDIVNTRGVRINKLNTSALTLIDSVLAEAFPNIWSSITSTLRERGGIDTDTGKPYEEVYGEDAMKRSDHSRFTYSPAFDVSVDDSNGIPLEYFFDVSNIPTLVKIGTSGYEVLLEGPSGHFGEFEKNFNSKGVFVHPVTKTEIPHIKRLVSKQPHYHFGPRRKRK